MKKQHENMSMAPASETMKRRAIMKRRQGETEADHVDRVVGALGAWRIDERNRRWGKGGRMARQTASRAAGALTVVLALLWPTLPAEAQGDGLTIAGVSLTAGLLFSTDLDELRIPAASIVNGVVRADKEVSRLAGIAFTAQRTPWTLGPIPIQIGPQIVVQPADDALFSRFGVGLALVVQGMSFGVGAIWDLGATSLADEFPVGGFVPAGTVLRFPERDYRALYIAVTFGG